MMEHGHEIIHIIADALRNGILITGLVIVMMIIIECVNVASEGRWLTSLRKTRFGQVLIGAGLGALPGCLGGFATVSLYSHNYLSFGALVAMLIASSGDETFVMLAMFPGKALLLFGLLFVIAVVVGLLIDIIPFKKPKLPHTHCDEEFVLHSEDMHHHPHGEHCSKECPKRTLKNFLDFDLKRVILFIGVALFIIALATGMLEHEHGGEESGHEGLHLFDEYWINLTFAILCLFVLWFIAASDKHFVHEHLWNHVVKKHLPSVFCWTFGILIALGFALHYLDLESWTKANIPFMILLAILVGMIPESGPHLIFVTLFASGMVPFSVLAASSISQDGHSSIPLLAESKMSFLQAKLINMAVAALVGYSMFFLGF